MLFHGHYSSDSIKTRNFSDHLEISSDLQVLLMGSWKTQTGNGFYRATLRSTAISLLRELITSNSSLEHARHALCKLWDFQPLYFSSGLSISDVYIYIYIHIYIVIHLNVIGCCLDVIRDPHLIRLGVYRGWDSSVGTATCYGLDNPGIESWWWREFPHPSRLALGPTHPSLR